MELEEILQKHFGLKSKLYLDKPVQEGTWFDGEKAYRHWTVAGQKAYIRMTSFLYDFDKCLKSEDADIHIDGIIDKLDSMESDNY